jgi:Tfp pilus assembly protein PilN
MKAVNLLPSDLRGPGKPGSGAAAPSVGTAGRVGAFAVLGVLAFGVVALAAYVLTANTVKDRRAQLAQATAESAAVTERAAKLKPYADFQAAALSRIETVKDLATQRFDWEQALRDLSRAVPTDVTLTSMSGSISSDTADASTGSDPLRGAIGAPAVTLQGCTHGQRSVAELMARLRAIRGVTRVALSKSERPDASATSTSSGATGPIACRGNRPPTFSLVIFFEHASVPASLKNVTVGAAAGSGTTPAAGTTTPASGSGTTGTTGSSQSGTSTPASTTATTPNG